MTRTTFTALLCVLLAVGCDAPSGPAHLTPRWNGVIEGFYGPPYRHAERLQILAFVAEHGLDTYLYAPKQDPYHRDEWRTPYPASEAADLAALITRGSELGVRVVLAIAPGGDYDGSSADEQALRAKLDQLLDLGARDVCVLFDDVASSSPVAEPVAQVAVLRLAYDHVRARTPDATLCFIGPYYFGHRRAAGQRRYAALPVRVRAPRTPTTPRTARCRATCPSSGPGGTWSPRS
ncbi:MAG: beta-N-acetylglucosaminidase domain-containing protein [Sandaracinaceae bacterium]|nr:beta-N-acetylglucosaminidase domain-containing protein [Sandaracinaceae bacterium]